MYNPIVGNFKINGQTFYNFEGEFEAAQSVITAYLDKIGGDVDPHDDFWGLPDDDALVTSEDGTIGILSSNQFYTL